MTTNSAPILIVPYMWIGDFVRCHSAVKLLNGQYPDTPVDLLSSSLCAPLAGYMPGVRKTVVFDLPRRSLPLGLYRGLARRLREERYAQAIIMPRTWKSALAPALAGIPKRTGFLGEMRFGLINDVRPGERKLPRMIDRMAALVLPTGAPHREQWPLPELRVRSDQISAWRSKHGLNHDKRRVVALAPGAVGKGKAWPVGYYAMLARRLADDGCAIWVLGGPNEQSLAAEIASAGGNAVHDLTAGDLGDAVVALAIADVAVTNDSGLMHIAAALGTPTVAIFGPSSPWHWAPLNPLAAILEPPADDAARERAKAEGNAAVAHRRTSDVAVETVLEAVRAALAKPR
jgi:heptosyltransferase-2